MSLEVPRPERNSHPGPLAINYAKSKKSLPLPIEDVSGMKPISFANRPMNSCGWLIGEARNLMCCGAHTNGERYYCNRHHRIAYIISRTPIK